MPAAGVPALPGRNRGADQADATALAAGAARGFEVLQCEECAEAIRTALVAAGHRGQLIEIRGGSGRDFMVRLSYDGGQATTTQNGRHEGVRVADRVFDNLHPDGMPLDEWLRDFDAIGGVAAYSTVDFLGRQPCHRSSRC